jgi:hypothetical protein
VRVMRVASPWPYVGLYDSPSHRSKGRVGLIWSSLARPHAWTVPGRGAHRPETRSRHGGALLAEPLLHLLAREAQVASHARARQPARAGRCAYPGLAHVQQ